MSKAKMEFTPFTDNELNWYVCILLNRCHKCYRSLENNLKNVVRDQIDHIVMEEESFCLNCGASVDYCAQGSCQSDYEKLNFELEHPKAAEIVQSWIER